MRKKGIIFDMDGVIVDSEPLHCQCTIEALKDFGVEITLADMDKYVGVADHVMIDSLIEEFSIKASREELLKRQDEKRAVVFNKENMVSVSGTLELIKYFYDNGFTIGLASSSPRYLIEIVLKNFDILKYFTAIVSGEELERSKPHPDIYLKAADQIGISPTDCMAIDDANSGVRSAKAAGMYTIGYKNPNSGAQDLSTADIVIQDMEEVYRLLEN